VVRRKTRRGVEVVSVAERQPKRLTEAVDDVRARARAASLEKR
jgi:hypothetical protein